jgi:hypothetical protein
MGADDFFVDFFSILVMKMVICLPLRGAGDDLSGVGPPPPPCTQQGLTINVPLFKKQYCERSQH